MCRNPEDESKDSSGEESEERSQCDDTDDEDSPPEVFRTLSELNQEFEERRANKFKSLEELTREFKEKREATSTSEVKSERKDVVKEPRAEAQPLQSYLSQAWIGIVERVFEGRGFGFITPNDGSSDVFLHCSDIKESSERLYVGARVRYHVEVDEKTGKRRARNAAILDCVTKAATSNPPSYGRDQLLGLKRALLASKAARREGDLRIRTVYMPKGERVVPTDTQDPSLDDEKLIAKLEERLSKESGADAMNMETFGTCRGGWSFEEALAANAKLAPVRRPEECPSTASSGGAASEHHSSDSESVNGDWHDTSRYHQEFAYKEDQCLEQAVIFQ